MRLIERWLARRIAGRQMRYAAKLERRGDLDGAAMFRRQAAETLRRWEA